MRTIKRHVIKEFEEPPEPLEGEALVHAIANATSMQEVLTALGMGEHNDCRWVQAGRCVYCDDHNVRLFNGELPKDKR